jgi:hypothetical protein
VNAFGIGGIDIVSHLVTANAKLLGIRYIHRPVESAHKRDTRYKKESGDDTGGHRARIPHRTPVLSKEGLDVMHRLYLLFL